MGARHPCVAAVLGAVFAGDRKKLGPVSLIMEYCERGSLQELLSSSSPLDPDVLLPIVRDIAGANSCRATSCRVAWGRELLVHFIRARFRRRPCD